MFEPFGRFWLEREAIIIGAKYWNAAYVQIYKKFPGSVDRAYEEIYADA